MRAIKFIYLTAFFLVSSSCSTTNNDTMDDALSATIENLWVEYSKEATVFALWSPLVEEVKLNLYKTGNDSPIIAEHSLLKSENGIWKVKLSGDLNGTYYTYQVKQGGKWLDETPGIYARAVGVNGKRAMVVDLSQTDPEDWQYDKGPELKSPNDAIIYELHVRDLSIDPESGIEHKGKFLGLAEKGTKSKDGSSTGLSHIAALGITHVHLLPSFDFLSIDESKPDTPQYNWGYDPLNYNVPEGSYATNPFDAEVRIKEFKEMVKSLHNENIGVILDVVYNHTGGGKSENSNFNLENPGYYYRHWEDGKLSDASACGNETASDKPMMRKFMIESVLYWAKEYHIDGFRFDLMAIHDIETMNELSAELKTYNPNIIIYGEGWTAGDSPLSLENRALKAHTKEMPKLAAFSDDLRDAVKGSVFDEKSNGFVSGKEGLEESIKFGVVGCIEHPQINNQWVNYSKEAWASEPWQSIAYVSCHDNHTLFDKIQISKPNSTREEQIAMANLANAIVLTSQGVPFLHAGSEMLRTKQGNHNSYNLPDSINQIDWNWKKENQEVVKYYEGLIKLRKEHPAFRMPTAAEVQKNLEFKRTENGLVAYQISNNANGDSWKNILVIYNAKPEQITHKLPGEWKIAVIGDEFMSSVEVSDEIEVPAISILVAYQE